MRSRIKAPACGGSDIADIYAYTDEAGNTGSNLFDLAQPWFWTATLLAPANLDSLSDDLSSRLPVETSGELHAAVLGPAGVESVATAIRTFLEDHDCEFAFTRIEKAHVSALKLADTLLDSGTNPAVSAFHYSNRFFRLSLAAFIVGNLSPKGRVEFWRVYGERDIPGFLGVLERLRWNISNKVENDRIRELLLEAIDWARSHPQEIPEMQHGRDDADAPNMIAITLLLNSLQHQLADKGSRIERFVHDEQNQFAKVLKMAYSVSRGFKMDTGPFSWMTDIELVDNWSRELEFMTSDSSVGLQITDVVLWLARRLIDRGVRPGSAGASLVAQVMDHGTISESSGQQLTRDVINGATELMSRPINPEDEARGMEIAANIEKARRARLRASTEGS